MEGLTCCSGAKVLGICKLIVPLWFALDKELLGVDVGQAGRAGSNQWWRWEVMETTKGGVTASGRGCSCFYMSHANKSN